MRFLSYHCVNVGHVKADASEEVRNSKHNEDPIMHQVHVGHLSQRLGREGVAAAPNGRTAFTIVGFTESGLVGNFLAGDSAAARQSEPVQICTIFNPLFACAWHALGRKRAGIC